MRIIQFFLILVVTSTQVISIQFVDNKCDEQLFAFTEAIREKELWALRLFDLWGKVEAGYLLGNFQSHGRFSECLNFTETVEEVGKIQGQHCMISWTFESKAKYKEIVAAIGVKFDEKMLKKYLKLSNGLCLPATCSSRKVIEFTNVFLIPLNLTAVEVRCQTKDAKPLDILDISAICCLSIFSALLIASTAYDLIIRRSKDREPHKLLIAFSVYTNGQKLFKVDRSQGSKNIGCLEGMRCISFISIVYYHRNMHQLRVGVTNPVDVVDYLKYYWSIFYAWPTFCVDTFLVIAGFLSALHCLKSFEQKKLDITKFVFHRYIRYTTVLAAAILLYESFSRHVKGFEDFEPADNCRRYWWTALLHIQNYFNPTEICGDHLWYLSVDFQLYIITPILIYPTVKYGWKYLWILPVLAFGSSIITMQTILANKLDMVSRSDQKYFALVYYPSHTRMAPWLIGMVLAYIIFKSQNREVKMNKAFVALLWTLSFAVMAILFALYHRNYQVIDSQATLMDIATVEGFMRLIWSFPMAWIIFACYKLKSGGIIRWFLSSPEWQPIGKLTLSMYITHQFYQRFTIRKESSLFTAEALPVILKALGDFAAALILGTIFWLTFELPFVLIEQYFERRPQKKSYELSSLKTKDATKKALKLSI